MDLDPEPLQGWNRIRISHKIKIRIQIRIPIHIKVISRIRFRNNVMRIRNNTGRNSSYCGVFYRIKDYRTTRVSSVESKCSLYFLWPEVIPHIVYIEGSCSFTKRLRLKSDTESVHIENESSIGANYTILITEKGFCCHVPYSRLCSFAVAEYLNLILLFLLYISTHIFTIIDTIGTEHLLLLMDF